MILSFRTDLSGQIVQTQIRLLLEEQSDQGLHYLPYCLHILNALLYGKTSFFHFRMGSAVAWWLMPRTPEPEVGGSNHLVQTVLCP